MRSLVVLLAMAAPAFAGGIEPRLRPADYPQHVQLPGGGFLALEYHGRGLPAAKGSVFLGAHIVLEVAYFPSETGTKEVRGGHFAVKIDKMKHGFGPETPGMVAASLKYSDWERRRGLTVEAGPIVYGPGGQSRRFPGGPSTPEPRRMPRPDGEPEKPDPQDLEADAVKELAFPEGETTQVVAGYLYYRWGGNLKKMKKLVLDFSGPGGPVSLEIPLR